MDTLLKADIFFFVTTIVVVLLAAIGMVAAIYIIKILRDARAITGIVRAEADRITEDIAAVRDRVRQEGMKGLGIMTALAALWKRRGGPEKRKSRFKRSK